MTTDLFRSKFWELPSEFLRKSFDLYEKDKEALYRQLEEAPRFNAVIAVTMLALNPQGNEILQRREGLFQSFQEKFSAMPTKLLEKAKAIAEDAMGMSDKGDEPPVKRKSTQKELESARKALQTIRALLREDMEEESEYWDAWKLLNKRLETLYGPKPGDVATKPPARPRLALADGQDQKRNDGNSVDNSSSLSRDRNQTGLDEF